MKYKSPRKLGQTFTSDSQYEFTIRNIIVTTNHNRAYADCTEDNILIRDAAIIYNHKTFTEPNHYYPTLYNPDAYFIEPYSNRWYCLTCVQVEFLDDNQHIELYTLRNASDQHYLYLNKHEFKSKLDNKELLYIGSGLIKDKSLWDEEDNKMKTITNYETDYRTMEIIYK